MQSQKFSSSLRAILAQKEAGDDQVSVLIQLDEPLSESSRVSIQNLSGQIRTEAGSIITLTLPQKRLGSLAEIPQVTYIDASQLLYPDSPTDSSSD